MNLFLLRQPRTLAFIYCCFSFLDMGAQPQMEINSPDGSIAVTCYVEKGKAFYTVTKGGRSVLEASRLGLRFSNADYSTGLRVQSISRTAKVTDNYSLVFGKKKWVQYVANRRVIRFKNEANEAMEVIFQVSNDGLAFRYRFAGRSQTPVTVTEEMTSFHVAQNATGWLQPMSVAKTGWEHSNPSYEEHYKQEIKAGTPSVAGWVYPALFKTGAEFLLISEADVDSNYCATRLVNDTGSSDYRIGFPDPREVFTGRGYLPIVRGTFLSPWRLMAVGSLATIAESTLGTDLAPPTIKGDMSFVKPGKASWSWINSKDDSIVYSEQKRYIDYAADMHWQYCLIDADWDRRIGYEKVKELADYALSKKVGLLLWYNSAGDWNTTPYHPRDKMLTHASREAEFARLNAMGIKGVKIDFFGGDGQSVIAYYHDILLDAAKHQLLVNFHGATLPRGWSRTYPHLLTTEAIRGFEMITFGQRDADLEPTHCTLLPFTRNAFDPMDFTPMNLYHIYTSVKRRTSSAFELALSVLFLSGIQHYAESPEGMSHMPAFVKEFLRHLPDTWDDVRLLDASLGKYVVLARKSGNKWYIAGINGQDQPLSLNLALQQFHKTRATLITDANDGSWLKQTSLANVNDHAITLGPNEGFVIVLE